MQLRSIDQVVKSQLGVNDCSEKWGNPNWKKNYRKYLLVLKVLYNFYRQCLPLPNPSTDPSFHFYIRILFMPVFLTLTDELNFSCELINF